MSILDASGQPIGGPSDLGEGRGKISAAIRNALAKRKAKEEQDNKEMIAPVAEPDKAPDTSGTLAFTHKQWVKVYSDLLDHILAEVAQKVSKLSATPAFTPTYKFTQRLFTDSLPAGHSSGAAAVVGCEVNIMENGVTRQLMRKTRHFRTMLEFKAGVDQGLMEAIQEVYVDLITFAVTTDIATRYEHQHPQKPQDPM